MTWKQNVVRGLTFIVPRDGRKGFIEVHTNRHPHVVQNIEQVSGFVDTTNLFTNKVLLDKQTKLAKNIYLQHQSFYRKFKDYFTKKEEVDGSR